MQGILYVFNRINDRLLSKSRINKIETMQKNGEENKDLL